MEYEYVIYGNWNNVGGFMHGETNIVARVCVSTEHKTSNARTKYELDLAV